MLMLKKLIVISSNTLLSALLFLFFVTTSLTLVLRPTHIKQWIDKSGVYSTLTDTVLKQAAQDQDKDKANNSSDSGFSLSDPAVQTAAKAAFTPEFLRTSTEQVVDGTFRWLDGTVPKPDFKIDVSGAKERFGHSLSDYAKTRYAGLPVCAPKTAPTSTDPLLVNCRASGVDFNAQADTLITQATTNKDFLPNNIITADTLNTSAKDQPATNEKPFYESAAQLPVAYGWLKKAPIIISILALLCGLGLIFASASKSIGLKRIAHNLLYTGLVALLFILLSSFGYNKLRDKLTSQTSDATQTAVKNSALNALKACLNDFTHVVAIIAGLFTIVGVVTLVLLHKRAAKNNHPKHKPSIGDTPTAHAKG